MKSIQKQEQSTTSILVSAVLIVLLVGSVYISQLIFQEISKSFNIDILDARSIFSLSCFFYAISFFIYGPLSDKVSTRFLVVFGSIGTIICLGLSGIVESFSLYLIIMSLIGFFAASVPAALFAYTAKNTPNEKLPQAMGVMISASIVGIIFSRSVVAMMTDYWSWQIAFFIYALLIVFACLFIPMGIKNTNNNTSNMSIASTYLTAAKLLLNKTVLIFLFVGFLLFFVYLGLSSLLTFYLKGSPFYLSSTVLGWLNFAGISAVIGTIITGKLSQFMTKGRLLIICLVFVSISVITIGFSTNLFFIALGIFCLFLFVFGLQPIVISILNQIVPINSRGAISSLYLLSCLAGGSIGTYVLGIFYENFNWNGVMITSISLTIINIVIALFGLKLTK
ncbi:MULTISPECIES: MFS transporter [unclassified Gilliamella]|uniref:MFS transporter n=1 Tax=unclassified Gilliamella TaxID=2685620 RepID=UPI00226AB0EC|nr:MULTISPECIES: MFS transporter [unclassified Gilliamella]MCX8573693.1 MFS transporter [Gilliamella sp. B3831]MCX8575679.1 MFS transporter [Gilliamella sp. B3815]MCX8589880.1 MFS transporter [Gilliamella sp. B3812]MCX8602781.1 MFS transporter [Gilliamella sp. B3823]MCX8605078.1 MFS transporter [Gilliamella sp. B3825]